MEVRLLDTFPHYEGLGPTEVVALGGFGTISPRHFLEMKGEDVEEKVRIILYEAVARGYASLTTSALLLFSIKGSRLLDLFVTAFPFGSYMVLSQRFVPVREPVLPKWVGKDVRKLVEEEIKVYGELLEMGIRREEARGVLGLGTPSHMLAVLPVESVANMLRWGGEHPEITAFLEEVKSLVLDSDAGPLLEAALRAPAMGGPFPHPFHRKKLEAEGMEVERLVVSGDGIGEMERAIEEIRARPPRSWEEMVTNAHRLSRIAFEHINDVLALIRARVPLTLFNELKRHRTIPIEVESIYRAMERGSFYTYPSVANKGEAKGLYDWVIEAFRGVEAPEYEKVYGLPQAVEIGVRVTLNFAQLTAPSLFFRIRSCEKAETSMKQFVRRLPFVFRDVPGGEALFRVMTGEINGSRLPLPKCVVGACPEPEFCPLVRVINPAYDEELHRRIKKGRK